MDTSVVSVLVEGVRQERKQVGRLGWIVVAFGIIVAISSFKIKDSSQTAIFASGLLCLAFGAVIVWRSRRAPEAEAGLVRLVGDPKALVWFYVKEVRRSNSHGVAHLWLCFADGTRRASSLPPGQEEAAQRQVAALCPEALVGHSEAREQAFRKDPRSFCSSLSSSSRG